jgi:hypothetical protein
MPLNARIEMSVGCLATVSRIPGIANEPCDSSKVNPSEFIGWFERLAITRVHGDADK